jgi:hypothetical protein
MMMSQELCQSGHYQTLPLPEQQINIQLWLREHAPVHWQDVPVL